MITLYSLLPDTLIPHVSSLSTTGSKTTQHYTIYIYNFIWPTVDFSFFPLPSWLEDPWFFYFDWFHTVRILFVSHPPYFGDDRGASWGGGATVKPTPQARACLTRGGAGRGAARCMPGAVRAARGGRRRRGPSGAGRSGNATPPHPHPARPWGAAAIFSPPSWAQRGHPRGSRRVQPGLGAGGRCGGARWQPLRRWVCRGGGVPSGGGPAAGPPWPWGVRAAGPGWPLRGRGVSGHWG